MHFINKLENKFLPGFIKGVLVFSGAAITLLISFQIVGRFVGISYRWTQEAARLLVIWATFAYVALGIKRESLLMVNIIDDYTSGKVKWIIILLRRLIILLFSCVLIYYGFISVFKRWNQLSPGLTWPMSIFVLPLPLFSVIVIIHLLYKLINKERG